MHRAAGWSGHSIATSRPTGSQRQVQPANTQQLAAAQPARQATPSALQEDTALQLPSYPCSTRRAVLLGGTSALAAAWQLGVGARLASAKVDPSYLAPLDGVPLTPADRAFVERLKTGPARKAGAACPAEPPQQALRPVSGSAPQSRASAYAQLDSVPLTPLDQLWLERFKAEEALRAGSTPV